MTELRTPPRIEALTVKNYRALKALTLNGLTPLSIFIGPNGGGKSTLLDVFAFLSDSFQLGLRKAWNDRGRFKELRSRGAHGPIEITLKYRETPNTALITYSVAINEVHGAPIVQREKLQWRLPNSNRSFVHLDFSEGTGAVTAEDSPKDRPSRVEQALAAPDLFAVNTLGQLASYPRVVKLRQFITGWYFPRLSVDSLRLQVQSGIQERLSVRGDNLANVVEYLQQFDPARLKRIEQAMQRRVPYFESVHLEVMPDSRLLLRIKDKPFQEPIPVRFSSDGTLKLLAYLTILYDPQPPSLVGIEEPENYLHHRLLPLLAEEFRMTGEQTQLMVTTHSPLFLHDVRPEELWIIYRKHGYTCAQNAGRVPEIVQSYRQGIPLGYLWSHQFFEVGDPLNFLEKIELGDG